MRSGVFHTTYREDMAIFPSPLGRARIAVFLVLVVIFPFVASPYWLSLANQVAVATVGAIGLNILVGFTGQISLGQGAFMAIGAYVSGVLSLSLGVPFWLSIPLASLATALSGLAFGLPSLRLKGLYLAIATLAAQQIVEWVLTHWTSLTGGTEALVLPAPTLFGARVNTDFRFYWIAALAALTTALFATNLFRSRAGRAFLAVRDQDIAAAAAGVPVFRSKLAAFAVSSFFVGMAGALIAQYRTILTWERFTLDVSVLYLAMIIIGGLGSVLGSFMGALVLTVLPSLLASVGRQLQSSAPAFAERLPATQEAVFGIVVLIVLIVEPRGLAKLWSDVKTYFRLWPFSR
jgi:branched-chain amino acid transport system permease protein